MIRSGFRALLLLPLLAVAAEARAHEPPGAVIVFDCAPGQAAGALEARRPARAPLLTAAEPLGTLALREGAGSHTTLTRAPRHADGPRLPDNASAARTVRARFQQLTFLEQRTSLAAARRGSYFGSTAPPPSLI